MSRIDNLSSPAAHAAMFSRVCARFSDLPHADAFFLSSIVKKRRENLLSDHSRFDSKYLALEGIESLEIFIEKRMLRRRLKLKPVF